MAAMPEVAQLMHDHVVNTVYGGFDQLGIEQYGLGGTATSPSTFHSANAKLRGLNPVSARDLKAPLEPTRKDGSCPFVVPLVDERFDSRAVTAIRGYEQVGSNELPRPLCHPMSVSGYFEAVLATQVLDRLSADVALLRHYWQELLEKSDLASDPCGFRLNPAEHLVERLPVRCGDSDIEIWFHRHTELVMEAKDEMEVDSFTAELNRMVIGGRRQEHLTLAISRVSSRILSMSSNSKGRSDLSLSSKR